MKYIFPILFFILNIFGTEFTPQKAAAEPVQNISFADAIKRASSLSIETNRARQNAKVLESDAEIADLQIPMRVAVKNGN